MRSAFFQLKLIPAGPEATFFSFGEIPEETPSIFYFYFYF